MEAAKIGPFSPTQLKDVTWFWVSAAGSLVKPAAVNTKLGEPPTTYRAERTIPLDAPNTAVPWLSVQSSVRGSTRLLVTCGLTVERAGLTIYPLRDIAKEVNTDLVTHLPVERILLDPNKSILTMYYDVTSLVS